MKTFIKIFSILVLLLTAAAIFSQEADPDRKKEGSRRFHSGTVLSAELLPENPAIPVKVNNVSPFEPVSKITSDVAYASVVVRLDPGRSISVHDYSLFNDRKTEFKCIGVREGEDAFDAQKWELASSNPDKLYTLLFRVALPPAGESPEYVLHFNLNKNKPEDVLLPFVIIDRPFISPSKIPVDGILGIDLVKEEVLKAEEEKKKAEAKSEDAAGSP
ncbi:MAG: hypothetical protein WC637_03185 [Victivallales bacterium]|jgi:hypothetical protein